MPDEHFHISKTITWGHIMTTVGVVGSMFALWLTMSADIIKAEHKAEEALGEVDHVKEVIKIQNENFKDALDKLDAQYEKIDDKLDNLISQERNGN